MTALPLVMTAAGQNRFTAAQLGGEVDLAVSHVGLTAQAFVPSPSLTALPGRFASVATVAGAPIGEHIVHLTIRDDSPAAYQVRGFGLFLADGTLFAVYGQADPMVEKSAATALLLAIDIAFPTSDVTTLVFGATDFIYPPATTDTAGVARVATQAEVDAGVDPDTIVTPHTLAARLQEVVDASSGAISDCIPLTQRGQAQGVATLGADELVVPAQLPPLVSPDALAAALARLIPAGTITLFFGAAAPAGWALCDGDIVQRADGSGTFATPDLRGRVAVGVSADHALGAMFGQMLAAAETDPAQTGVTLHYSTAAGYAGGGSQVAVAAGRNGPDPGLTDPGHAHSLTLDVTQPSLALTYIIKL